MTCRKDLIIAVLATFCLTSTLFTTIITTSQPVPGQYDPWLDYNDDGTIFWQDLLALAMAYQTSGDPTKNVNVTNWPEWLNAGNVTVTNFPLDEHGSLKVSSQPTRQYLDFYCQDYGYGKLLTQFLFPSSLSLQDYTRFDVAPMQTITFSLLFDTFVDYPLTLSPAMPIYGRVSLVASVSSGNPWDPIELNVEIGQFDGTTFASLSSVVIQTYIHRDGARTVHPFIVPPLTSTVTISNRLALKLTFTYTEIRNNSISIYVFHTKNTEETSIKVPVILP